MSYRWSSPTWRGFPQTPSAGWWSLYQPPPHPGGIELVSPSAGLELFGWKPAAEDPRRCFPGSLVRRNNPYLAAVVWLAFSSGCLEPPRSAGCTGSEASNEHFYLHLFQFEPGFWEYDWSRCHLFILFLLSCCSCVTSLPIYLLVHATNLVPSFGCVPHGSMLLFHPWFVLCLVCLVYCLLSITTWVVGLFLRVQTPLVLLWRVWNQTPHFPKHICIES